MSKTLDDIDNTLIKIEVLLIAIRDEISMLTQQNEDQNLLINQGNILIVNEVEAHANEQKKLFDILISQDV